MVVRTLKAQVRYYAGSPRRDCARPLLQNRADAHEVQTGGTIVRRRPRNGIILLNMSNGVGIVEPKTMELALPEGGFRLGPGGVLKKIEVRYEECGAPMRDGNVIFICHALTTASVPSLCICQLT